MQGDSLSAKALVARFLKTHQYTKTLDAFLQEAGLPPDVDERLDDALTIEKILSEKRLFDMTASFEKTGLADDGSASWYTPFPSQGTKLELERAANVLQVGVEQLQLSRTGQLEQSLLVSTADRQLSIISAPWLVAEEQRCVRFVADSPILSFITINDEYVVFSTMSGCLHLYDPGVQQILVTRKDHSKWIIKIAKFADGAGTILATAGWDSKVLFYRISSSKPNELGAPFATIQLQTLPESILFKKDPISGHLYLICSRRDSSLLYYYKADADGSTESHNNLPLSGRQNLAPYANAWISFSAASISPCPTDDSLVAVVTTSTPHMKALLVRLLFPRAREAELSSLSQPRGLHTPPTTNQLGIDPREAAAVIVHCNTYVAQTKYSTPVVVWRPDGSGFWVNSEEGVIKGIDRDGKVQATLQKHDPGSKIRCLWAGYASIGGAQEEVLVSGGFDQSLIVWRV